MRKRATAVILRGNQVLLMRRVKPQNEYYIFPGGGIDEGETPGEAAGREVLEETSLSVTQSEFLFSYKSRIPPFTTFNPSELDREDLVFKISVQDGLPVLSGPEKESQREDNQYHFEWVALSDLAKMENLYPVGLGTKVASVLI